MDTSDIYVGCKMRQVLTIMKSRNWDSFGEFVVYLMERHPDLVGFVSMHHELVKDIYRR